MTQSDQQFGTWLKRARRRKKISQTALCDHIDALPGEVSWWESGKSEPTDAQLAQIREFFGEPAPTGKASKKAAPAKRAKQTKKPKRAPAAPKPTPDDEDRNKNRPTRERLVELYHDDMLSLRAIAAQLDTTAWHVRRWMDEYEIQRRSQRRAVSLARKRERDEAERLRAEAIARGEEPPKRRRPRRGQSNKTSAVNARTSKAKSTGRAAEAGRRRRRNRVADLDSIDGDGDPAPAPAPEPVVEAEPKSAKTAKAAKNTVRVRRKPKAAGEDPSPPEPVEAATEPEVEDEPVEEVETDEESAPGERRKKRPPQVRVLDLRDEIFGDRDELERQVLGRKGAVLDAVARKPSARAARRGDHPALATPGTKPAPKPSPKPAAPAAPAAPPPPANTVTTAAEAPSVDTLAASPLAQLHHSEGFSVPEIADLRGESTETVVAALAEAGVARRSWRAPFKLGRAKLPPRKELADALEQHETPLALAAAYGVSLARMNAWLEKRHLVAETGTHVVKFQRVEDDEAAVVSIADGVQVTVDSTVALDMSEWVWSVDDEGRVVSHYGAVAVPLVYLVLGIEPGEFEGTDIEPRNGNPLDLRESNLLVT